MQVLPAHFGPRAGVAAPAAAVEEPARMDIAEPHPELRTKEKVPREKQENDGDAGVTKS